MNKVRYKLKVVNDLKLGVCLSRVAMASELFSTPSVTFLSRPIRRLLLPVALILADQSCASAGACRHGDGLVGVVYTGADPSGASGCLR